MNPSKPIRGYYHLSRAWYGKANLTNPNIKDEVTFGLYYPGDGCEAEMSVKWHDLGNKVYPRLEVFDESWKCLLGFSDVIKAMSKVDGEGIAPIDFCKLLDGCGFKDLTPLKYEDSYPR